MTSRVWPGMRIAGGFFAAMLFPLAAHTETNRIILRENFESFRTTKALRAAWPGGSAELIANAPGGGHCVSHDGTGMNRRGGFYIFPDAAHNIVLEADFYDFGTNTEQNVTVTLNAEETHENVVFGLKAPHGYMARVGGISSVTNSIPFKRGQLPIEGWHHFRGVVTTTNFIASVDFGRDGKVDHTIQIPFNKPAPTFTQVRFGGYATKLAAGGVVLVDNLRLELEPVQPAAAPVAAASVATNQAIKAPSVEAVNTPIPRTNEPARARAVAIESNTVLTAVNKPAVDSSSKNSQRVGPPAPANIQTSRLAESQPVALGAVNQTIPVAIWWIGGSLGLIIVLLGVLIAMMRRHTARSVPLLADSTAVTGGTNEALVFAGDGVRQWRDRAMQAEALAAKQAQILKEKVGPELVQFAKETLVQGLYNQRNALLETQTHARRTLAELESRLSELKLPSQERITVYEKRIAELEKQLESRNDEMRELTRATLLLMQEKLLQERASQRPRFN